MEDENDYKCGGRGQAKTIYVVALLLFLASVIVWRTFG